MREEIICGAHIDTQLTTHTNSRKREEIEEDLEQREERRGEEQIGCESREEQGSLSHAARLFKGCGNEYESAT